MEDYKLIRFFDLLLSITAIVVFSPIFIFTALIIIIDTGFPIFFIQKRVGLYLRTFHIVKFRSMYYDPYRNTGRSSQDIHSSNSLYITTAYNDKRITRAGKIIRKYSLDEFPQFINVFLGEMSIVGPRPDTPFQEKDYKKADWEKRHTIKPGITGLAQVNGRSNLTFEDRLKYDLKMVEQMDFRFYCSIIFRTVINFFQTENTN